MEEPLQCHCLYNSIVVVVVAAMVQAVSQKEAILLSEAPLSFLHFLPDPVSPVWDARIVLCQSPSSCDMPLWNVCRIPCQRDFVPRPVHQPLL